MLWAAQALTMAVAVPGSALKEPSLPPNSTATMRPRPRMSMMGYRSDSLTKPCIKCCHVSRCSLHKNPTCQLAAGQGNNRVRPGLQHLQAASVRIEGGLPS